MDMVLTVTLNPCIDETIYLDGFVPGGLNMALRRRSDACGKGVNVALVLRALGIPTMCTGISFDGNGHLLATRLDENCIAHDFAIAHGNIRTNIKLTDLAKNELTEINSAGEPVSPAVLAEYFRKLKDCAARSSVVVMSGRIPNGAAEDIYQKSLHEAAGNGLLTVVDAEKQPLRLAVAAKPTMIKPNAFELEATFGCRVRDRKDAAEAAFTIIAHGVQIVCVSMGADGALIAGKAGAYYAHPLPIEPRGFQGAGDSMVAGLCKGLREGAPLPDMLRFGAAAAAGSLEREGTLLCRREDFDRLLPQVRVEKM